MSAELTVQLNPHVGESINGYALRVAEANFAENMRWLNIVPQFVDQVERDAGQRLFGRLPKWLNLSSDVQEKAWPHSTYYLLGTAARYCAECMAEQTFWRATWEHPLYTVCHRHGCYLHDRCRDCGIAIDWNRAALSHCICGAHFAKSASHRLASPVEVDLALCIASKLNISTAGVARSSAKQSAISPFLSSLSIDDLASLVRILGTYLSGIDKSTTTVRLSDMDEVMKITKAGAEVISDWPNRFNNYLSMLSGFDEGDATEKTPPKQFLNFTKSIQNSFNTPSLSFVLDAQRHFMIKNWYRVLDERNTWANNIDKEQLEYISLPAAARMLGISCQRVKLLVSKGELKALPKISSKSRKILHVEKQSLGAVKELFGDRLTLSGTAVLLGISEQRTEELVTAGLLQPVKTAKRSHAFREFSRKEAETLLAQLQQNMEGVPSAKKSFA